MDFLTERQVKAAAKNGKAAAVRCTVIHWEQILAAEYDELDLCDLSVALCALCVRYKDNCPTCPIVLSGYLGCMSDGSLYARVRNAKDKLNCNCIDINEFRITCIAMLEMLREL